MNLLYLIFFLLIICLFIWLFEFNRLKKLTLLINIIMLYLFFEIFLNIDSYYTIFLSSNIWKNILFFMSFLSFIIIISIIKDFNFEVLFLNIMVFLGSLIIITCDNLIILYLSLELQTFSLFILISGNRFSIKSSEGALKYFILGALSSGLFLLGVSLLFSSGFSLNLKDMYLTSINNCYNTWLGFLLICLSLFFKLAIFPLHFWIPDIYEGSSWEVIILIATIPKISIISIILKFLSFSNFFIISALFSIIIGSIGALNQTKLKRLLAYSGISHIGYILLGFGLLSHQSLESSFIYLFIYLITMLGLFILILKTNFTRNYFIIELGGLNLVNKIMSVSWLIFFLSIAGIPPLSGFISKWVLLNTILNYSYLFPVFLSIIFSAISAGYYLRIIKIIYFQKLSSYINWKSIMTFENNYNSFSNYFMGFIIYLNLTLIFYPIVLFKPFYLSFNYFY